MKIKSPEHAAWHRKVEGQVRDVMHHHPEWFNATKANRKQIVQGIAKRIVGEIIAAGYIPGRDDG